MFKALLIIRYQPDTSQVERGLLRDDSDNDEPVSMINRILNRKSLNHPTPATSKLVSILTTICCKKYFFFIIFSF